MVEKNYKDFIVSILVVLIYPLLPIIFELTLKQECLDTTLTLTTAIYSITVLTTSENPVYLYLSVIPGLIFSILYVKLLDSGAFHGVAAGVTNPGAISIVKESHSLWIVVMTILSIIAIALIHGIERYKRHVTSGEAFLNIKK